MVKRRIVKRSIVETGGVVKEIEEQGGVEKEGVVRKGVVMSSDAVESHFTEIISYS